MRAIALFCCSFILVGLIGCAGGNADQDPSPQAPVGLQGTASQQIPPPDSALLARFEHAMQFARDENLQRLPVGRTMQEMGEMYLGAPYIVGPLDESDKERLVCRLDGFDCYTFVESMLSMAHGIVQQEYDYLPYARRILSQRYREGVVRGYCSRIHYFTEWIRENEDRGAVRDITQQLGGERLEKTLDFMSKHRGSYRQLANDSTYACIQDMEENLADMTLYHIPQDRIRSVYSQLQAGDIVATATNIEGLDVSHTGLVYAPDGQEKGLLHASTSGGVKVSSDLQAYVQNVENQIGIIVARPLPPDSVTAD